MSSAPGDAGAGDGCSCGRLPVKQTAAIVTVSHVCELGVRGESGARTAACTLTVTCWDVSPTQHLTGRVCLGRWDLCAGRGGPRGLLASSLREGPALWGSG